jgi:hypothetical protein
MDKLFLSMEVLVILVADYYTVRHVLVSLVFEYLRAYRLYKKGKRTLGVIISFTTKEDSDKHDYYDSIVEFIAEDGCKYTINSDSKYRKPEINKKVEVAYADDNPLDAIINSRSALNMKLFLVLLTFFVIVGANLGFFIKLIREL